MEKELKYHQLSKATKIVAITGAESTGKSTLAYELSKHYNVPFEPEFAREYVQKIENKYAYSDVEFIAKKQIEQYENLLHAGHKLVILDTWLLITKVWFDTVFNKIPDWIEHNIISKKIDLFLVCDTNLPWIPDVVRENGGTQRLNLQERYVKELNNYGFPYKIISGVGTERTQNAISSIDRLFN